MSRWPTNPYLESWLRTDEGRAYLRKHGVVERPDLGTAWNLQIVEDPDMPPDQFTLVSGKSFATVTNVAMPEAPAPRAEDPWEF